MGKKIVARRCIKTEDQFETYWNKYESRIKQMIYSRYARSLEYRSNYFDDLYQAAKLGLYQAIPLYDSECNNTFWTFARKRIEGSIKDELSRITGAVYAPRRIKQLANKIGKLDGLEVGEEQLSEEVGSLKLDIRQALRFRQANNTLSIYRPIYMNQEDVLLADMIYAPSNLNTEMMDERFLAMLNKKECRVATLLNQGYSAKEVCKMYKNGHRLLGRLGEKLKNYLKITNMGDDSVTNQLKGRLTKEKYLDLRSQNISNKQIAVTHKMSPTTLAKMRRQWGIFNESNSVHTEKPINHIEQKMISEEEHKRVLSAYARVKCEYELLWRYHKQVLQHMDSPFPCTYDETIRRMETSCNESTIT